MVCSLMMSFKHQKLENLRAMKSLRNENFFQFGRAQPLHLEGDVTSALSGNSIVGKKEGDSSEPDNNLEAKMLLFNGNFSVYFLFELFLKNLYFKVFTSVEIGRSLSVNFAMVLEVSNILTL